MEMLFSAALLPWIAFFAIVIALMAFDLGVLNKTDHEIGIRESLWLSAFYIAIALLFGVGVWHWMGAQSAIDYYTGFLVEKSLSMDNVFVFALIFSFLGIPRLYQYRVLVWGIIMALVLRAVFIGFGAAAVAEWSWILWFFGAFLIVTGIKMLFAQDSNEQTFENNPALKWMQRHINLTPEYRGHAFWFQENGVRWFTPLFVALVLINFADIIFAVDSVPAILAITQDPFIVYTSNIFAILGLRALYFALSAMIHRFHYLKYALALILVLIGIKIVLMMIGIKLPALLTLGLTFGLIAGGVGYSLWKTKEVENEKAAV
ncbi:TerC Membrane protein TerC, possibly involved in tellurium resistance [uncultured Caudovirales phage]|uniref:TerC Membrane protein TerC, possibly involved in tellurium resistance n=1 Tax=uncultured Caudovirales phage TaxID=2100421 RepID=A0A6J5LTS5_9CAUD|nr:TerC Membrane protein TerC, possibly involved in tellurium resistance [uncultured Caudovirales phage]